MVKHLLSTLFVISARFSNGFLPPTSTPTHCQFSISEALQPYKTAEADGRHEGGHATVPSKPKIFSINNAEELKQFLEEDDRLCAIKFHASWCKSCKAFGQQFERIGKEIGDLVAINNDSRITRQGEIRLGEIEYGKNVELSKSLGVKKVPSICFYYNGKILDFFPCGPKRIAYTLERLSYFRSLSPEELAFEANMGQGNALGHELLARIDQETSHLEKEQTNIPSQ